MMKLHIAAALLATSIFTTAANAAVVTLATIPVTTQTTAPAGAYSYQSWDWRELGRVTLVQNTNKVMALSSTATLVDQGWGGEAFSNGVRLDLFVGNDSVWARYVAGANHGWSTQAWNIANDADAFASLNTALGTVNWAATPDVSIRMNHAGIGWGGWSLTTKDASFSVSSTAAVPEPATWGMLVLGFGMAGAGVRSRQRGAKVAFA